jgi:hypothetical protein
VLPPDVTSPRRLLLCNLDVDNFFQSSFPVALAEHVRKEDNIAQRIVRSESDEFRDKLFDVIVGLPVVGRGAEAGTMGRVAIFGHDFCKIGGHDEDSIGVGYQDVDILRRIEELLKTQALQWPMVKKIRQHWSALQTKVVNSGCGTCFLNFAGDCGEIHTKAEAEARRKRDRGSAKIANVDPEIIQTFQNWTNMNAQNTSVMKARLKSGEIVRNMGHPLPEWARTPHEHLEALFFANDIGACRHEQG